MVCALSKLTKLGKRTNGISPPFEVKLCSDVPSNPNRKQYRMKKERQIMSNSNSNKIMVPNAREAMNKFKMEAANDLAVPEPS